MGLTKASGNPGVALYVFLANAFNRCNHLADSGATNGNKHV